MLSFSSRPAHNIDINRNLITFETVEDLREAAKTLAKAFGGGVVRCKNFFSFPKAKAAKNFHYRNVILSLLFAPNIGEGNPGPLTYGAMAARDQTKALWDDHLLRFPQNPNEPWTRWRMNAMHARRHLEREEFANLPVHFICEVQLGLRVYTDARGGAMHFLYKVVRAATPNQLYQDFKIPRKVDLTYDQMQLASKKAMAKTVRRKRKEKHSDNSLRSMWGKTLSDLLIRVATYGHSESIKMLFLNGKIPPKLLANHADTYGQTSLYKAAFHGHLDCCRLIVQAGGQLDKPSKDTGATPLAAAAQNGHYRWVVRARGGGGDAGCGVRNA